jgi:hypothetical protein
VVGCFARACTRVGESFADTVDLTLKVRGCTCPFKTTRRAQLQNFSFPSFSSSRARTLLSEFFRIRSTTTSCASSPPKTLLP